MRAHLFAAFAIMVFGAGLAGCNGYAKYYSPNPSISPEVIAERRIDPPPAEPELVHGGDPKVDIPATLADGYILIGSSSFHGPQANDAGAVAQGKIVGADRVLIFNKYLRTDQGAMPLTTPTVQTSFSTGTATAFGSGGSATAFGSGTTTTYGTETTYIPYSIEKY